MRSGMLVLVQIAVNGGAEWRQGVVIASYPSAIDATRRFDVALSDGRIVRCCSERSLRTVKEAA